MSTRSTVHLRFDEGNPGRSKDASGEACANASPSRVGHAINLHDCGRSSLSWSRHGTVPGNARLGAITAAIEFYGLVHVDATRLDPTTPAQYGEWHIVDVAEAHTDDLRGILCWARGAIATGATVVLLGLRHDCPTHESLLSALVRNGSLRLRKQNDGESYFIPIASRHLSGSLAGAHIPWRWARESGPTWIAASPEAEPEWVVLAAGIDGGNRDNPYVLVSNAADGEGSETSGRLVLVADTPLVEPSEENPDHICPAVMAALLLVRMAAPERSWHHDGATANFTIDDPNLVEPYGRLSYERLVMSMKNVGYHTTIAFIPWNHRRTHADVVDLFKRESHWLSLAVHGNNHDGYEFGMSAVQHGRKRPPQRSESHQALVDEALRRMIALRQRTGLPFAPVMIFPHGIGTVEAIAALDRAGYLASANRQSVPLGSSPSRRFDFGLRPADTSCGFFPLMQRWWPVEAIPELSAFLGKPILIYAHERDFGAPLAKLEEHVERINRLGAEWRDLAGASRSLYLTRDLPGGETQVWMFGREVEVANRAVETREFVFYRDEASGSDLDLGTQAWSCDHTAIGARCCLRATLAPGERIVVRLARCRHHGASGGNAAMVSDRGSGLRKSAWIALRRHVCDWRDRYLSRLGQLAPEGTAFTAPYVAPGSRSVPNTPYTPEPRRAS